MTSQPIEILNELIRKGVRIQRPETVEIGGGVDPQRIAADCEIYPGCRIYGEKTWIGAGTRLGEEAPVTLDNCQLGELVRIKGGYAKNSTFLDGVQLGSGVQVREACLLEEAASCAHSVGLKQTILFPFVTLGSLINFCDCLMAGGTSRSDHSEVGSSYIHFNYTPNQDKATASLIGDVPRGVMLDQRPIFLGGQGGLVGPARIAYGTVIAAGSIQRGDVLEPHTMVGPGASEARSSAFDGRIYRDIRRKVRNNIIYIANLHALRAWYAFVRQLFMPAELYEGAAARIEMAMAERIKRLGAMAALMETSADILERAAFRADVIGYQRTLAEAWPELASVLGADTDGDARAMSVFLEQIERSGDYLDFVRQCPDVEGGVKWLDSIVQDVMNRSFKLLPKF